MTSLLIRPASRSGGPGDQRHRRPLVLVATAGGVVAAAAPLLVCLALGVVGWFLVDAGSHGEPHDGLRAGATAWLMAHGSGLQVGRVAVTVVPLGLTLLAAWCTWRVGVRVGDAVSGHGPDADAIADGARDWTVPVAAGLLGTGYAVVAVVTASLAATPRSTPSVPGVLAWTAGLVLLVGVPALATGSGRAAIWASYVPPTLLGAARTGRALLRTWLLLSALLLLASFLLDVGTAANVMSQLHTGAGDVVVVLLASLALLPNAVAFAGSYLAGPGFLVGTGTLVSPTVVVLGPLPMFPALAALPDAGPTPGWTAALVAVPPLVAAAVAARVQHLAPTPRWDEGALRGCVGGALAAVGLTVLAALAGGAVGPGRMRDVTPLVGDLLVHSLVSFGLGGLVGGLAMTAWQRRSAAHLQHDGADH